MCTRKPFMRFFFFYLVFVLYSVQVRSVHGQENKKWLLMPKRWFLDVSQNITGVTISWCVNNANYFSKNFIYENTFVFRFQHSDMIAWMQHLQTELWDKNICECHRILKILLLHSNSIQEFWYRFRFRRILGHLNILFKQSFCKD